MMAIPATTPCTDNEKMVVNMKYGERRDSGGQLKPRQNV